MSQQIIIPASPNETKMDLIKDGSPVTVTLTFPPSGTDGVIDVVLTEITTTTTTTTTTSTSSTTTTTTKPPTTTTTSTTTTTTKAPVQDFTLFGNSTNTLKKRNDGEALELGVKFTSSKAGSVKGVRFYKATGMGGVHTANLWDSNGNKLATAQFTGETATGWQQVAFTSPIAITAGTTYTVSVYLASGDYISQLNGLSTAVNSGPLSTVVGSNGVFIYGVSAFPNGSYQNSNYYIDLVFSQSTVATTTTTTKPPTTTSTTSTTTAGNSTTSTTTKGSSGGQSVQGYGSQAVGGSNSSDVRLVSNKAQFDAAIGSNRTIKFTANASFVGRYDLSNTSYLTIDGNGFDVVIDNNNNGDGISFNGSGTHHCILKGITVKNGGNDGINVVDGAHDILITNCSSYGNADGNIDVAADNAGQTKNVTVQYCILGDNHGSGKMLVTGQNVSVHHNVFSGSGSGDGSERNPFIHANYSPIGAPNCDFRNNVVYNWGRYGSGIGYKATANFVNNYYASNKDGAIDLCADPASCATAFVAGNYQVGNPNINSISDASEKVVPDWAKISIQSACDSARETLGSVGPRLANGTLNTANQAFISPIAVPNC